MSIETRTALLRWVVPCCSLLLIMYGVCSWGESQQCVTLEHILHQSPERTQLSPLQSLEGDLQSKARSVLANFGEGNPMVVVTVSMTSDWEDVETLTPLPESKVLESIQTVGESKRGEENYANTKSAENYKVGYSKTLIHKVSPRVEKVSCLVQLSQENAGRCSEVEQAIFVALGMDAERGDTVLAVPSRP